MKIKIKASAKAIEDQADRGDFVECPDGYYVSELVRVEQRTGKQSKQDYLNVGWKPVGLGRDNEQLPETYGWVWDSVQLEGDSTEWKRAEFLLCLGKKPGPRAAGMDIEVEEGKPGTVLGTLALIKVGSDFYTPEGADKPTRKAIVKAAFPWSEDDVSDPDEAAAEDDDQGTEPEAELDFDGDDGDGNADPADAPDEEPYEPWTDETLREGSTDEVKARLKEIAESFDVKIVKGMTLNDVITMILEAQEAYMATLAGDDSSDDDTFGDDDAVDGDEPF